jgi:hypothetical protein
VRFERGLVLVHFEKLNPRAVRRIDQDIEVQAPGLLSCCDGVLKQLRHERVDILWLNLDRHLQHVVHIRFDSQEGKKRPRGSPLDRVRRNYRAAGPLLELASTRAVKTDGRNLQRASARRRSANAAANLGTHRGFCRSYSDPCTEGHSS